MYFISYFSIFNTTGCLIWKFVYQSYSCPVWLQKLSLLPCVWFFIWKQYFTHSFWSIYIPNSLSVTAVLHWLSVPLNWYLKNLLSRPLRGSTPCGDITLKSCVLFQDFWPYIASGPWDQCCFFLTVLHFNNIDNTYCRKLQDTRLQDFIFSFLYEAIQFTFLPKTMHLEGSVSRASFLNQFLPHEFEVDITLGNFLKDLVFALHFGMCLTSAVNNTRATNCIWNEKKPR